MATTDTNAFQTALFKAWSRGSSSKWKAENPALGQCGVTALVAQDWLGGEIVKTWVVKPGVVELWHFYNVVDGEAIDFTRSQFDEPIGYDSVASNRDEAFADTNSEQYDCLRRRVEQALQGA